MKEKKLPAEKTDKTPPKPPREFRKPLKAKNFEKRYLKKLEHPEDRKFFADLFVQSDDTYVLREGLGKNEIKKLTQLLKVIKQNRKGAVKVFPLAFAAIVIGAIIVFFMIFANPLLGRAMEKGLEAIFEAKANVYNFRLNVFKFSISVGGITVANRDKPMTNLFEMGRTVISLNSAAVLRGKIYINEISAASLRFGTPRKTSGALPGYVAKIKEKPVSDEPPLVDLKNFDAMALLNREYEKLRTPKLYDEAFSAYNEISSKYKGQVDLAKTRSEELKAQAQPLLTLNVGAMRDVQTITKTVQDITTMVNTVQTTADDAAKMVSGLESDIKKAQALEQSARTAITDDINHLKSYIDLSSGAAFAALEPSIREVLSDTGDEYLDYGIRALEILEKLRANALVQTAIEAATKPSEKKPGEEKPKKVVFKGRDVVFPVVAYPKFYLGRLSSDFTIETWNWAFDLRNVSSDPDITYKLDNSKPAVTLAFGMTEDGGKLQRQVKFNGMADFRTDPKQRFSADLSGKGFPFELGNQMSKIGINGFSGITSFSMNLNGNKDGSGGGGGNVHIYEARLLNPEGTIAEAVAAAMREANDIQLGIDYKHWIDRKDEFNITTNIANLIAKALKAAASAYAQKAMDEIEKALRAKINQYVDERFVSKDEVDAMFRLARGDKAAVDQLKNSLNNKKNEFEKQIKEQGKQVVEQVKNEAIDQGKQATQDILQGKQPAIKAPSVPSTPSVPPIKLPGR